MKPHTTPTRILAVGIACLLTLSGCSSSDNDGKSAEKPKSPSPSTLDTSGISPQNLPTPPAVTKAKGAVSALQLGKCAVTPGKHTVKGTITSPAKKTTDYLVVVNWSTDKGDVMGRGYAVLRDVKPAEKRRLAIKAKVSDGASRCVPFVQYGSVKK